MEQVLLQGRPVADAEDILPHRLNGRYVGGRCRADRAIGPSHRGRHVHDVQGEVDHLATQLEAVLLEEFLLRRPIAAIGDEGRRQARAPSMAWRTRSKSGCRSPLRGPCGTTDS